MIKNAPQKMRTLRSGLFVLLAARKTRKKFRNKFTKICVFYINPLKTYANYTKSELNRKRFLVKTRENVYANSN